MLLNNTITINDNPVTLNQKLAQLETDSIIENFELETEQIIKDFKKDFGFDLLALPNLNLSLKEYCRELVAQAYNDEMESSGECLQCLHNSVNHHCPCQYK
jgi:hypothetical protein